MTISPSELFAPRVPRYTSYPTAPHFHREIGEATYRRWLAALPDGADLSLYVHVPFCDTLCWFCGCNTTVVNNYKPVSGYLDVLLREMEMLASALKPGHKVTHLHFGGGSPTLLTPGDFWRLNKHLRQRFEIDPDAEVAIEIDPRGFRRDLAETLAAAGVTRASIGVQDCDPVVQRAINRIQPESVTAEAIDMLRDVGIRNLNIDVMYGLPHQTAAGLGKTLDSVLALNPDRLAVFGYAHVPTFKKHMSLISEADLPGIDERFAQAELVHDVLLARGYVPIGIDHFARPDDSLAQALQSGRLSRNFQGYTADDATTLLGLGPSAIGTLQEGYVQNLSDVPSWRTAVRNGQLPIAKGICLTADDRARRAIIGQLMCQMSVDLGSVVEQYGLPPASFDFSLEALRFYERDGIVSIKGRRVDIAPRWRSAARLVAAAFDTYLDATQQRHARAI